MRKKLLLITCLLGFAMAFAQDNRPAISISATDSTILQILMQIESTSSYRFYFVPEWFSEGKVQINFVEAPIEEVLSEIFEETEINFYLLNDTQIVLSRNNQIYDQLPEGFFQKPESDLTPSEQEEETQLIAAPVFYAEERSPETEEIETVRVGRENTQDRKNRYRLSGAVRNKKTNEPVGAVSIIVKNRGIGTVTNDDGLYQIDLPAGENLLETRFLGMRSVRKRVLMYNDGQLDLQVEESVQQLSEVVLEGDRDRNVEEEITGTEVIESEETKEIPLVLGERNVLQVATTLPGISTAGEGASGINVRGGKTDQNLFLMDDAVVYNPTHFFGIFQALNPFVTKSVEIYKGNIPVEFAGRLSSVFDIKTIDGNVEKFVGEASIGPVTGNLALEIPITKDKSSLVLGGRGAYSDWILRSLDEEDLSNSQASFYDVILNYTDKINENNRIKATAYYSKDLFSITSDSLFGYSNRAASLVWNHKFSEKNSGSLIISNSRYAFDIEFDGESNTDFDLGYSVMETEVRAQNNWRFNESNSFNFGISAKLYNVNPGTIDPRGPDSAISPIAVPEEKAFEAGVFIGDNIKITDKLGINAGVSLLTLCGLRSTGRTQLPRGGSQE